jgi:NAD(P) transhydrogenase
VSAHEPSSTFDFVVIGGGPAGQSAALTAAKAGQRVLVVERDRELGGECLHRGTIPSKTLRETVLALRSLARRTGLPDAAGFGPEGLLRFLPGADRGEDVTMASLVTRLREVVTAQEATMRAQLRACGAITVWHGQARFASPHDVAVYSPGGRERVARARHVVLACGSRPRQPDNVAIDHELVLDSDSILSMTYLPRSLIVLGAGVVASEYASIFAGLGVRVTMCDPGPRPMAFLDPELTNAFAQAFAEAGGSMVLGTPLRRVESDGAVGVDVELGTGVVLRADKVLCALGRTANVAGLALDQVGIAVTARGHVEVDASCRTTLGHVYAIGDLAGPPALASAAMEQGRRAVRHALGLRSPLGSEIAPFCAYTIPEIASVGLTEAEAIAKHGAAVVGRACYRDLARARIAGYGEGLVKLVASPDGTRLLGAQIVGDGGAELVHVAQMALVGGQDIDVFVETTFNFPTLAEGLRVAALDVVAQREGVRRAA